MENLLLKINFILYTLMLIGGITTNDFETIGLSIFILVITALFLIECKNELTTEQIMDKLLGKEEEEY
jgi:hypothetical protein